MQSFILQVPIDLKQVLQVLAAGGGTLVIGMLFSLIARKSAWYAGLSSEDKSLIMMTANILLGLVSTAVILFVPQEIIDQIAPFYVSLILCSLPYVGSQVMHALNSKPVQRPELEISGTVEGDVNVSKPQVPTQTTTHTTVETTTQDEDNKEE